MAIFKFFSFVWKFFFVFSQIFDKIEILSEKFDIFLIELDGYDDLWVYLKFWWIFTWVPILIFDAQSSSAKIELILRFFIENLLKNLLKENLLKIYGWKKISRIAS